MDDFEVRFNTTQLVAAAESVWPDANMVLGRQFQQRITANQWPWPTDPSPRDIVDTGQLRDSYTPIPMPPNMYEHGWDTEYAMAVHEGAVRGDGGSMPGRPWVRVTLRDFDFAKAFGKLAQSALNKVRDP